MLGGRCHGSPSNGHEQRPCSWELLSWKLSLPCADLLVFAGASESHTCRVPERVGTV